MNFYDSIIEGAQELPAAERGQLYTAALEYLYFRREPDFPMRPAPKAMFVMMRPIFDNQLSAAERGKRGGRPQKTKSQTKAEVSENGPENEKPNESKPKAEVSEKGPFSKSEQEQEQEIEKELPGGSSKKRAAFAPPSLDEVRAYIAEKGYSVDADRWYAHYEANGWMVGRVRMRDWRASVRTWEYGDKPRKPTARKEDGFDAYD